jgi:hypothetical protein
LKSKTKISRRANGFVGKGLPTYEGLSRSTLAEGSNGFRSAVDTVVTTTTLYLCHDPVGAQFMPAPGIIVFLEGKRD